MHPRQDFRGQATCCLMAYQTIVIDYAPKAKSMAAEVEKKANEMEQEDWELVSFAITNSAKGILVFHRPDNDFRD